MRVLCVVSFGILTVTFSLLHNEVWSNQNNVSASSLATQFETYSVVLARIEQDLNLKKSLAAKRPDSWLHQEWLAMAYMARGKLTGNFEDYAAAQKSMKNAFSVASVGSGPVKARAKLNYSLHRIPAIEADLQRVEEAILIDIPTKAWVKGMRADVDLDNARFADAKSAYLELEGSDPTTSSAARLAKFFAKTGDYPEAQIWLERAEQRVVGRSSHLQSWLQLQQGILDLDRGRWNDAMAHYKKALSIFPGFWLVEEHIAEIDALQGRSKVAEKSYRELIQRTDSPVLMVALANVLGEQDDHSAQAESLVWLKQAESHFEAMLAEIPEALAGHALDYFLQSGDQHRALQLATDNYRLRPGGRPAVLLAQAYVLTGQLSKALVQIETVLSSPYRSADLHATAHAAFYATGQYQRAQNQAALARELNPHSVKSMEWLAESQAPEG